ncbi:hypothetical protein ACOMHN_022064 [Nucella lapillus]
MMLILHAVCFLLLLLSQGGHEASARKVGGCKGQADIIFVLDSSGSVGTTNFKRMLSFVKGMAGRFQLGPKDVRIGVTTFSNSFRSHILLRSYSNHASFNRAVSRIPYSGGGTKTAEALNSLRRYIFSSGAGHRSGVPKLAVVVTDGKSNDRVATVRAALFARRAGIHMIAVGIGKGVSLTELRAIASDPDSRNVFTSPSFSALATINKRLSKAACQQTVVCTSRQADIIFLLDASDSVGCSNFDRMLNFVQVISARFRLGRAGVQIGVATFSNGVRNYISLRSYSNHRSFNAAVKRIPYSKGHTNTARALTYLRLYSFRTVVGHRPGVPKVAVVVTDGKSSNETDTARAADYAKRTGIHMIAVGVGSGVKLCELKAIASAPVSRNVFTTPSFSALTAIRTKLSRAVCRGRSRG